MTNELADCLDGFRYLHNLLPIAEPAVATGVPLGDFRIVRELGRGGMGVVYEAEQLSLRRRVALKVLPFASTLDARQLQRFRTEATAAAHLHHPNVVQVYGVGCERGVHYYAMQYIEGRTLADVIRGLMVQSKSSEPGVSNAAMNAETVALCTARPLDSRQSELARILPYGGTLGRASRRRARTCRTNSA